MTKAELKTIVAQLESIGVPDAAVIKVQMAIDNSLIDLDQNSFKVNGEDASYTIDAGGHFAPTVSEINAAILLQA